MPTRRTFLAAAGLTAVGAHAAAPPLAPPDRQPPDLHLPDVPHRQARWAVVGLGTLALGEIMPAFARARLSRPTALVSGHPDKARRVAAAYGIDPRHIYSYDTFDRLKDDGEVDVVYIVLPNSMHAEYTIRALRAGKHVLCEKPMATGVAEGREMTAAARDAGRELMIAYRLRYEPFNQAVIRLCREKAVGGLRTFSASNTQMTPAPNIRLSRALGGGPVGDVGIYCINAARYVTGEEPVAVTAVEHRPRDVPRFREVPASVSFQLRFPSGVLAHCDCSFDAAESRRFRVHGTDGFIDLDPAFGYRGQRLTIGRPTGREQVQLTEVNHFAAEIDHFSDCVLNGKHPLTPGAEGLADMRVIAAVEEAARTGRTVSLPPPEPA
ncbi:MAG TPA: Gfo/Idh/MocA family oxidoreductase [Urbifossiella sp.]|jgi:predicted dehydrogenase|nr:Gfo/Idh/MocA family oxidoreductase [Urbifossiella sp.]